MTPQSWPGLVLVAAMMVFAVVGMFLMDAPDEEPFELKRRKQ